MESLESLQNRIEKKLKCSIAGCNRKGTHRPVIHIPKLEGIDKTAPSAEIEHVFCAVHASTIDPQVFLSLPVKIHLENALVKFAGRPILTPVDWAAARVEFVELPTIVVEG